MNSANIPNEDANSMDAVRDLLFGKKNQEIDNRFESLENTLLESVKRVEERMNGRMDSIHQSIKAEIEVINATAQSVDDRLQSEVEERKFELKRLKDDLGAIDSKCDDKLGTVHSSIEHLGSKSREELKEEVDCLKSEIEAMREEFSKSMNSEIEKLSASAAHRSDLSGFLIDLGMKYQTRYGDTPHEEGRHEDSVELHG